MPLHEDVERTVGAGLQLVMDKDGGDFVARAVRSGKTIAKGSDGRRMDVAVSKMVAALIALNGPKSTSQDDMLAKVFS